MTTPAFQRPRPAAWPWLVVPTLLLSASACRFVKASDDALYKCSRQSDCIVEGTVCLEDGYCHPSTAGADGGLAAPDASCGLGCPVTRDVVLNVDWPQPPVLDPFTDPRAWSIHLVLSDSLAPANRVESSTGSARGPFTIKGFTSSGFVDVTVEVRAMDTRLLGFGRVLHADVHIKGDVTVPVRRRIVYFTSSDRETNGFVGQLRAFDLGSEEVGEPGLGELPTTAPLPSVVRPTALAITADGRFIAQAGEDPASKTPVPSLSILSTGDHSQQTMALPFFASRLIALDGHALLAMPDGASKTAVFAVLDLDTRLFTPVPLSWTGGALDVRSAHRSPDGTKVAFAATLSTSATTPSRDLVAVFDLAQRTATEVPLPAGLAGVGGVRWTPDGKAYLVSVREDANPDWYTGSILVIDPTQSGPPPKILASVGSSKLVDLVWGGGPFLLANSETRYPEGCCGGLHVFDLGTAREVFVSPVDENDGPQFEIASAVRLPYLPFRVIGGQTDPGNNWRDTAGAFVDVGLFPPAKLPWVGEDIGSVEDAVTPFGESL